jgi:hypothetical protein
MQALVQLQLALQEPPPLFNLAGMAPLRIYPSGGRFGTDTIVPGPQRQERSVEAVR